MESPILHIKQVREAELISYDAAGRIYPFDSFNPNTFPDRHILIWTLVEFNFMNYGNNAILQATHQFGFNESNYCFGWPGKRLSSLPEHRGYFIQKLCMTTGDRDFIFARFSRGMFDV